MTKKSQYLSDLLRLMTPAEIRASAASPTRYMSRTHVLLHYVALRRLGAI
jgi:hypothetical protein